MAHLWTDHPRNERLRDTQAIFTASNKGGPMDRIGSAPRSMRAIVLLQRWGWIAGAIATVLAGVFVAFTLGAVQDSTRAAGDLGELRAFAERIRGAAVTEDQERLEALIAQRREHTDALRPVVHDLLGARQSEEVFANLNRLFLELEAAAATSNRSALDPAVEGVTAQVDLLLDLLSADRDGAVGTLRIMTGIGIGLIIFAVLAGTATNVLGQRRMRQLTRSEAAANSRYESLMATMQNGVLVTEQSGLVSYCNEAFAQMLGVARAQIIGGPVTRWISDESAAQLVFPQSNGKGGPSPAPPRLLRFAAPHGGQVDVIVAVTPILEDGECVAVLSELRNVSSEVALQQQMNLEAAKGEGILEVAPVPIVVIDESGTILAANPAVQAVLGWSPGELIGLPVSSLMPEPFASQHEGYIRNYLDSGAPSTPGGLVIGRERPAFALHKSGHQIPISIKVAESRTDDGGRVFTGVIYDLTRQSNLEGERLQLLETLMYEQRDVAVGTMVSGIAHDFNNLLTAIMGALDLEISARGESSRWLDHAAVATRRASAVVQRLLQSTRPQKPDLHPLDVSAVLHETVELARETFDRRVRIRVQYPPSLPLVLADQPRLGQVLLNLMINARDATLERAESEPHGYVPEIRVVSDTSVGKDGRNVVRIIISDNGGGISDDIIDRLFDPFFTTKRSGKGSGLGLTMVRQIMREIDGEVRLESTPGAGTSVTLDLPVLEGEAFEPVAGEPDSARPMVLVVDDEEGIRDVLRAALSHRGYEVQVATDGEAALEALRMHGHCRLVLLDLNMPGLSGWDALVEMRRTSPSLPVVIMSGDVLGRDAIRRGATSLLHKPFSVQELVALVDAQMEASGVSVPPEQGRRPGALSSDA